MESYRNEQMESNLKNKIDDLLASRYGGTIPADVADRVAVEARHIFANGHGTVLAAIAKLAEFSAERGYPVGVRGLIGNLYLAHLLGVTALDPMALGLHWEGCLGADGNRTPEIALNVAPALLEDMTAYLMEILPGCDPDDGHPAVKLCPHQLVGLVGEARRQAITHPRQEDIFAESLIVRAYHGDVSGIPVLGDLNGLQQFSTALAPKTFSDMTKLVGLCLAPEIQFQVERFAGQSAHFDGLIGTREDFYDLCVQHGIGADEAFAIMQQVARGGCERLTDKYRKMLFDNKDLAGLAVKVIETMGYLYPRGQCADYLYWALTVLWYKIHR